MRAIDSASVLCGVMVLIKVFRTFMHMMSQVTMSIVRYLFMAIV